ncbi:alpha/beta fold hydrolase [Fulvimonas soli]|jgi:pimeloyl-ACP methyl ester carboxylesterase|uniref:Pimeloyl-ACP methyl ester carboxylesterase n=1 Tax=Fulvimonas soli TaxID=155197 RepID=A0A316IFX4_9GAMM|nr:alpha/beta hydrolase [Fulvimonas soli]PWK91923.1 pimeloyl-ACP methyl ester carboxylesterase [Fulvimonas soli]TNY26048.1 alpha/beta hydrolase [Fulvimonas soli]
MAARYFIGMHGTRLAADVGGDAAAPPVILMHGGGQTRHAWANAFDELVAHGYHVISLDTRGHGQSDWAVDGDYSVQAQVGDLRMVIATLDEKPALVGASMGGVTSLIGLGADPELARALVLVDVAPRLEIEGIERIVAFMRSHADGFASLEEAAAAVTRYNPARPRPASPDGLRKNLRLAADGRYRWHWDPRFMDADPIAATRELSRQMLAAAERIRIPTLLVRGRLSNVISRESVAQLQRHIPHLEVADIEGAGHMVAGDNNDAFNASILAFLNRTMKQAH